MASARLTTDRSVAGLKLQKMLLEKKLAEVQHKVLSFQGRSSSRNQKSSRAAGRPSRSIRSIAGQQTASLPQLSLGSDNILNSSSSQPVGMWALEGLNRSQIKNRKHFREQATSRSTQKRISAASAVKSTEISHQLHQRNTELLTRRRNKVKNAGRLPSIQAPKSGAFKKHDIPPSLFPTAYKRGELPCRIEHRAGGNVVVWTMPFDAVDYGFYLPLFFEGLREQEFPYQFLARQGMIELVNAARGKPGRILPHVGNIIGPIRTNMSTRVADVVVVTLKCLQDILLSSKGIGKALSPFYRQLLPMFNLYKNWRQNLGDKIDYSQKKNEDIGDLVRETLELMERKGDEDAYLAIKYCVPTYESCLVDRKAAAPPSTPMRPITPYEQRVAPLQFR